MKSAKLLMTVLLLLMISVVSLAQNQGNAKPTDVSKAKTVEVFYFHFTHRCATCKAVESESKKALVELYGAKVRFTSCNLDEKDGKMKGKALKVSGQSLLIVSGNKKVDITNEGFMYARTNPAKLKAVIKEKTDALMK